MTDAPDFWWVTPVIASIAAGVAYLAISANQRIARMRATLDLVERTESSDHYRRLYSEFKSLSANAAVVLARLKDPQTDADKKFRTDIYAYLNHYELIALGCKEGILDEKFYIQWMRSQVVRDWHLSKEFVFFERLVPSQPSPMLFIEFETLARRFETHIERNSRFARFRGRAAELLRLRRTWR